MVTNYFGNVDYRESVRILSLRHLTWLLNYAFHFLILLSVS